jgi:hypothetical protein
MFVQADGARLVIELSVEWQTNSLQQQAGVLVVCGVGMDGDVHTRDHLGRVAYRSQRDAAMCRQGELTRRS